MNARRRLQEVTERTEPVLGAWVLKLKPDFAGRAAGGDFMVMYSFRSPLTEEFYWGMGHHPTNIDIARLRAMREIQQARVAAETQWAIRGSQR